MISESYLSLNKGWVVRGTHEIPRLYNLNKNKVVKLSIETLPLILLCDGEHTIKDICDRLSIPISSAYNFYKQFIDENIISETIQRNVSIIDIALGKKEPWLKEVHVDITDSCNLRCKHCFWGDNIKNTQDISSHQWKQFFSDVRNSGTARIVISGGEAFTSKSLLEMIDYCHGLKIMVASIFTNGTILDSQAKAIIDYIIKNDMETAFYISLDGYRSEQHDYIRGKGSFEKTIHFIEYLTSKKNSNKAKFKILINSLIYKNNSNNLVCWYNFLDKMGVDGWRFTTGRISGNYIKNAKELKINSRDCFDEYIKLIHYVIDKYDNHESILFLNVENFFTTRQLSTKKVHIFDENLCICDYKSKACSVDPAGNVQFCTGWQNIKYGNVFQEHIENIWHSKKMQEMKTFKISKIESCRGCKYLKYCGGGCRLECHDIISKDETICDNFQLYEEYLVPLMKSRGIEYIV